MGPGLVPLVAPAGYRGERDRYDGSVDLEIVATLLRSPDPLRLAYRRGIVERALRKKAASGVQNPDIALHRLKAEYLDRASEWCAAEGLDLCFPALRDTYYDGDAWIEPIRCPKFPTHVRLRHRLWTSGKDQLGLVDLIASPANESEQQRFREYPVAGGLISPFSKGKGIQVSIRVPEMRQSARFEPGIAFEAFETMRTLVTWYLARHA
jgi:hypothetical protein